MSRFSLRSSRPQVIEDIKDAIARMYRMSVYSAERTVLDARIEQVKNRYNIMTGELE